MAAQPVAVVLDCVALQRGQRDHHDLIRALFLELLQTLGEVPLILGAQEVGVVDHSPRKRRKGRVGQRRARPGGKTDEGGQEAEQTA